MTVKSKIRRGESREPRVKSRTMRCAVLYLAMALPTAIRAHAQCYIDPATGQRVCAAAPEFQAGARVPALDPGLSTFNSQPSTLNSSAYCRIRVGDGSMGSGTLILRTQDAGLVLTCAHLFDTATANIVVTFPGGTSPRSFAAAVLDLDRANDLAALAIRRPDAEPVSVYDPPTLNSQPSTLNSSPLTACGFGPTNQFRCIRGDVVGQATPVGATYPSLVIRGAVRPGDSGGGVLNERGELVGVIWGQRGGYTYATCGRAIREFMNSLLEMGGRGSRRANAGGGSPGGSPSPRAGAGSTGQLEREALNDWPTWRNDVEARLRALDEAKQEKGEYVRPDDLPDASGRFESIASRVEHLHEQIARVAKVAEEGSGFFQGLSISQLLAGALGLSSPLAAAIVLAGALARRRLKSRTESQETKDRKSPALDSRLLALDSKPIAVDSPPPPQQSVPETHYVSYESDSFAKAHQWASEQVVRKYPGATEILHAQDSLIKQHLAAQ